MTSYQWRKGEPLPNGVHTFRFRVDQAAHRWKKPALLRAHKRVALGGLRGDIGFAVRRRAKPCLLNSRTKVIYRPQGREGWT